MKIKTHSGTKKRVKIRSSKTLSMQKACKNHRLTSKSKRQKSLHASGMPISPSNLKRIKRLIPKI